MALAGTATTSVLTLSTSASASSTSYNILKLLKGAKSKVGNALSSVKSIFVSDDTAESKLGQDNNGTTASYTGFWREIRKKAGNTLTNVKDAAVNNALKVTTSVAYAVCTVVSLKDVIRFDLIRDNLTSKLANVNHRYWHNQYLRFGEEEALSIAKKYMDRERIIYNLETLLTVLWLAGLGYAAYKTVSTVWKTVTSSGNSQSKVDSSKEISILDFKIKEDEDTNYNTIGN